MKTLELILLMVLLAVNGYSAGCKSSTSEIVITKELPLAYIDSISPEKATEGQKISFKGHGTAAKDGAIAAYLWRSDKDGNLNTLAGFDRSDLSLGDHTVYFKVQDKKGIWSAEVAKKFSITVNSANAPVIKSFQATPSNIITGGSATLSWSVTGATLVQINNGIGNVAMSSSTIVSPIATTVYTLTAMNAAGSTTATTQVPVFDPPSVNSSPVINVFGTNPATIEKGQSSVLIWSVSNATSVIIKPIVGSVALSGTVPVLPSSTTSYTLTASNTVASVIASALVTVNAVKASTVTSVLITDGPASASYFCPYTMNFSASITADGPCKVTYRWEQSNGVIGPTQTIIFLAQDTQIVKQSWIASSSGNYWVRLHVLSPNEVVSANFSVIVKCNSGIVTNVVATGSSGSGVRRCPSSITFSTSITMDGPGTVMYHWEQSDGATSLTKSITFSEAGTQTVTYTWSVKSSGTYWAQLHTLKPTEMKSPDYTSVTITCE